MPLLDYLARTLVKYLLVFMFLVVFICKQKNFHCSKGEIENVERYLKKLNYYQQSKYQYSKMAICINVLVEYIAVISKMFSDILSPFLLPVTLFYTVVTEN